MEKSELLLITFTTIGVICSVLSMILSMNVQY